MPMKRMIAALCLIFMLLTAAGCSPLDDRMDKDAIFSYVEENRELLLTCVEANDFSALKGKFSDQGITVKEDHVEFDCGGAGFGSQTAYCGFFYTKENDIYAIWCAPPDGETFTQEGSGYVWKEENGDNRVYVEKICDGFYYWEASF